MPTGVDAVHGSDGKKGARFNGGWGGGHNSQIERTRHPLLQPTRKLGIRLWWRIPRGDMTARPPFLRSLICMVDSRSGGGVQVMTRRVGCDCDRGNLDL